MARMKRSLILTQTTLVDCAEQMKLFHEIYHAYPVDVLVSEETKEIMRSDSYGYWQLYRGVPIKDL